MRLLIITFDPPENIGGVEGRVQGYVRELTARGEFVEVEAFAPEYQFTVERFGQGGRIRLHKSPSRARRIFGSFRYTRRLMIEDGIDTVFLLSGGITLLGNFLLLYCLLSRKKAAILLYGKDVLQARKSRLGRMLLFLCQALAPDIAANSRYTSSLVRPRFQHKVSILYPSVDPNSAGTGPEGDVIGETRPGDSILFVGRLIRRKGVEDLINAMPILLSQVPAAQLEVVGDGPERERLERLVAQLGLTSSVRFFGSLRGDRLYERYRSCDVFAMPSTTLRDDVEGFGTVFLEAGLMGKPSVGTFSGGVPEAVLDGVTGTLVPEGDPKALAAALKTLLVDRELAAKLGRAARQRVVSDFTWTTTSEQLLSILRGAKKSA